MSAKFLVPVSAISEKSFKIRGSYYEYQTFDEETEKALYEEISKWKIRRDRDETMDHDEYGKYEYGIVSSYIPFADLVSLSKQATSSWLSGDMIITDGKFTGVVLYSGIKSGIIPLPENAKDQASSGNFCILYTNGKMVGKCEKQSTRWEKRAVYYYTDTFFLERVEK